MVDRKIIQSILLNCLSTDIKKLSAQSRGVGRVDHTYPNKPIIVFSIQIFQTTEYYFQRKTQEKSMLIVQLIKL